MSRTPAASAESPGPVAPARYFPIRNRRYDVAPNLTRLAQADFGNGVRDAQVFQFDRDFARYRASKLAARQESFGKYVLEDDLSEEVAEAASRRIVALLTGEHPALFALAPGPSGDASLACRLTGETLRFDKRMRLTNGGALGCRNAFDALLCQTSEDMAIVCREKFPDGNGSADRVAALHVCAPSHWRPADKIGHAFDATHAPVPGMERIRRAAPGIVAAMIDGPPTVRFTWGIEFDSRLNHHPDPPPGWTTETWNDRRFDPSGAPTPLVLRVERQVTIGLPDVNAALFAIRVYCCDGREIRANEAQRDALADALQSMSLESREYKSLGEPEKVEAITRWLRESPNRAGTRKGHQYPTAQPSLRASDAP